MEETEEPQFTRVTRKAVVGDAEEIAANPRARSAKLRIARRTATPAGTVDLRAIGVPPLDISKGAWL